MQLVWAVIISAVILGVPPVLWLFGVVMSIGLVVSSIVLGFILLFVLGPVLIYWKVVNSVESRRPDWMLSDVVFAIGGTVCFFFGIAVFVGVIVLLSKF